MVHRPNPTEFDKPMTPEEIHALRGTLCGLPRHEVYRKYLDAYGECRGDSDKVPSARTIQRLVTFWKFLWDKDRKRPPGRD
jgi:hypothetical protein